MATARKIGRILSDARHAASAGNLGAFLKARYRRAVLSRMRDEHVLYRLDGSALSGPSKPVHAVRIAKSSDVPAWALSESDAEAMPREWYEARLAEGAAGWVAALDGRFAACLWIITGRELGEWYRPIGPRDKVIYAVVAAERAKGRGIAPDLVRHALAQETEPGAQMLVDCKVWNASARRAFEKVGFRAFATVCPGDRWPVEPENVTRP